MGRTINLINCTGEDLKYNGPEGEATVKSEPPVGVVWQHDLVGSINDGRQSFFVSVPKVVNLPPYREDTLVVVEPTAYKMLTLMGARKDLLAPAEPLVKSRGSNHHYKLDGVWGPQHIRKRPYFKPSDGATK